MAYLPSPQGVGKMTPDRVIQMLFYFHEQAHFNHLQTTSFARHKALDKLYQGLEEFKDSIAELLLGYIAPKRIGDPPKLAVSSKMTDEKLLDELCYFADELYDYGETTKWWALSNKAAELSELGYKNQIFANFVLMQVQRINFPDVIPDNESTYLNYLEGLVESIDITSDIMIYRKDNGVVVRISPSEPKYFGEILGVIKRFHTMIGIQVEFSKSMKVTSSISYNINF